MDGSGASTDSGWAACECAWGKGGAACAGGAATGEGAGFGVAICRGAGTASGPGANVVSA